MKIRTYTQTYWSFGFILSRDCVLQQWEPYEVISHWEPYVAIYFGPWQTHIRGRIENQNWIARIWGKRRADRGRCYVRETTNEEIEF